MPEFIDHARVTYPDARFELGSMRQLPVPDRSVAGILAWYSLIHLPPDDLDGVLAELRRAMAPAGTLVVGFFDGDEVSAFEHKVLTAYYWPVDAFAERLHQAGFTEIERQQRRGVAEPGHRPHAAIAAIAELIGTVRHGSRGQDATLQRLPPPELQWLRCLASPVRAVRSP